MSLDRWIAVFFLLFSIVYGYAAYNYPLLPFEQNMVFLPNTMPIGLAAIGIALSLLLIFKPAKTADDTDDAVNTEDLKNYNFGQAIGLLIAMVVYALALRPIGFLAATTLFLSVGSFILGERKFHIMIPVSLVGAFVIWYLVQELLGVFLRPLPLFLGQ